MSLTLYLGILLFVRNKILAKLIWEKSTLRQIPAPPDHFAQVEDFFVNEKKRTLGKCHRNPRQHEFWIDDSSRQGGLAHFTLDARQAQRTPSKTPKQKSEVLYKTIHRQDAAQRGCRLSLRLLAPFTWCLIIIGLLSLPGVNGSNWVSALLARSVFSCWWSHFFSFVWPLYSRKLCYHFCSVLYSVGLLEQWTREENNDSWPGACEQQNT